MLQGNVSLHGPPAPILASFREVGLWGRFVRFMAGWQFYMVFTLFTNHAFPAEPNTRWRCPTVQNGTLPQHIKHQHQGDHAHTTIAPNGITSNLIETKTQPLSFSPNMWFWWESSGPSAGPRKFNFAQWRYSNQ